MASRSQKKLKRGQRSLFHNKQLPKNAPSVTDDYNMPHWINLSFYSTKSQNIYSNFVPRIKLPTLSPEAFKEKGGGFSQSKRSRHASQPDPSFPVLFDYNEYDRQVFKVPSQSLSMRPTRSLHRHRKRKETPPTVGGNLSNQHSNRSSEEINRLTASEPAPIFKYSHSHASSAAIAIPQPSQHSMPFPSSYQSSVENDHNIPSRNHHSKEYVELSSSPTRTLVGSDPTYQPELKKQNLTRRLKALVNPFNPSQIIIKLTSNRRRWTHVFPLGPAGIFMQQHHYQAIPQISAATLISVDKTFSNTDSSLLRGSLFSSEFDGLSDYKSSTLSRRELNSSSSNMSSTFGDVRSPNSGGRTSSLLPIDSISSIWGMKEQEWTPALTTGVDWKSLVIPACLPITTDYFPDQRSLHNDYVLSDYSLLPEDIIAENSVPKYFHNDQDSSRRPLTTVEVYKELICQRLQQGFQIILLPKHHSSYPIVQVSSSPQFNSAMFKNGQKSDTKDELLMSIGRIFHKLNLEGHKITITQYRPRHPHREITGHYRYRFHAPDSDTYGVSWVNFTSERLENYNWNYLDHYICMRGEGEFELAKNMKYWRLRMLLLPAGQPETKKIIEGSVHCDLYNKFSNEEKVQQREGILKFLENMNKIRRTTTRKPKMKLPFLLPPRRSSIGHASLSVSGASSLREKVSSIRLQERPRMRSNSARMGARPEPVLPSGRISPATEADGRISISKSDNPLNIPLTSENPDNFPGDSKKLNENSPETDIIKAMKHPQDGLNFIAKPGWSSHTFISFEAVAWVMEHVEGVLVEQQAIKLLQQLVDKELICHVSRKKNYPFVYGFYLFYLGSWNDPEVSKSWDMSDINAPDAVYLFEREWMEVEFTPAFSVPLVERCDFPSDEELWSSPYLSKSKLKFKECNVQIDNGSKSKRQEWGQLSYQNVYRPYEAFEIIVEWMVATGNKAAELVQGWARKSNQYNLQLVPIPSDPFALPFSDDSDPLRGPIFIPLDLSCLMETSAQSFDEEGLLKLQEKILCKFGFIPYRNHDPQSPPQYVHISGSMFVMLPIHYKGPPKKHLSPRKMLHLGCSPHDDYIVRHYSGVRNKRQSTLNTENDTRIGFLWSWNYMITKRWKNAGTVDENFMRKVMRDFREFCLNYNSRLEEFWKHSDMADSGQDPYVALDLES